MGATIKVFCSTIKVFCSTIKVFCATIICLFLYLFFPCLGIFYQASAFFN